MAQVIDTSSNGIIDSTLIRSIITELNNQNTYLKLMGYEGTPIPSFLQIYSKNSAGLVDNKGYGAEDFFFYSGRIGATTIVGTSQGTQTFVLPSSVLIRNAVCSVQCANPALLLIPTITAINSTNITVSVNTPTALASGTAQVGQSYYVDVFAISNT